MVLHCREKAQLAKRLVVVVAVAMPRISSPPPVYLTIITFHSDLEDKPSLQSAVPACSAIYRRLVEKIHTTTVNMDRYVGNLLEEGAEGAPRFNTCRYPEVMKGPGGPT